MNLAELKKRAPHLVEALEYWRGRETFDGLALFEPALTELERLLEEAQESKEREAILAEQACPEGYLR